jgi:hypothetical protein
MNDATSHNQRDTRLLELLAELEQLGHRDQAVRELASYLGTILKGSGSTAATSAAVLTLAPIPLAPLAVPPAMQAVEEVHPPALPHSPTLADNPLASHAVSLLPLEWQAGLHTVMHRITFSVRTLAVLIVVALALGVYSGQVTIPASIREYLSHCPQPKAQP